MGDRSRRWTPEEDAVLLDMHARGCGYVAIARVFGISPRAISQRIDRIHTARPVKQLQFRKRRECLSCGRPFMSEWIGNRRCAACLDRQDCGYAPEGGTSGRQVGVGRASV